MSTIPPLSFTSEITQTSTPGPMLQNTNVSGKLPFQTSYEEYDKFKTEINPYLSSNSSLQNTPQTPRNGNSTSSISDPSTFIKHLESVKHLESRLNYRFLELEAKLRFLRLLTAGTELSNTEYNTIDTDSAQLQTKVESLNLQIDDLKKINKNLRKKISKCFHQTEIRRCIEGKPILQDEIDLMLREISECRKFFELNGLLNDSATDDVVEWAKNLINEDLLGLDILENSVNKIYQEKESLSNELASLKDELDVLVKEDKSIDAELIELESEKLKLEKQLEILSNHEISNTENDLINNYNLLNQLVDVWKAF